MTSAARRTGGDPDSEKLGATADHVWVDYSLSETALRKLADAG